MSRRVAYPLELNLRAGSLAVFEGRRVWFFLSVVAIQLMGSTRNFLSPRPWRRMSPFAMERKRN